MATYLNRFLRLLTVVFAIAGLLGSNAAAQTLNPDVQLLINAATGATSIVNTGGTTINIESYSISSDTVGFLSPTGHSSLGGQLGGTWEVTPGGSVNALAELNPNTNESLELLTTASQGLGNAFTGFNTNATLTTDAQTAATFGVEYLDVRFLFGDDDANDRFEGSVVYENQVFNNLVLEVDVNSGDAVLKNESPLKVDINQLQIASSDSSVVLNPGSFTALDTEWDADSAANSATGVAQFVPATSDQTPGESTYEILGGASFSLPGLFDPTGLDLGDIDNFSVQYNDVTAGNPGTLSNADRRLVTGDFDGDGDIDGGDFLTWQRDNATPAGLSRWQNGFGLSTASASVSAISAVPEPAAMTMLLLGACSLVSMRKR